jgi:hypothetical protein
LAGISATADLFESFTEISHVHLGKIFGETGRGRVLHMEATLIARKASDRPDHAIRPSKIPLREATNAKTRSMGFVAYG